MEWARELTRSPEHCLALVVWLKSFQRLGYFPELFEVPIAVVEHVQGYLGDHHEHLIKTVPRTSRMEVRRHKAYGHTTNRKTG